jgi:hypothetical protein
MEVNRTEPSTSARVPCKQASHRKTASKINRVNDPLLDEFFNERSSQNTEENESVNYTFFPLNSTSGLKEWQFLKFQEPR